MSVLQTRVDPRSEAFRVNYDAMLEQVKFLDEQLALANAGGGAKYVQRHRERGKRVQNPFRGMHRQASVRSIESCK